VKEKRKLLQLRGKIAYARQAKCILAATTLSAAEPAADPLRDGMTFRRSP
jgi:hypothetical protein